MQSCRDKKDKMTDLQKLVKEFTDALIASEQYQELRATLKDREYICFWMPDNMFYKCSGWGMPCDSAIYMPDYDHTR